MVGTTAYRSPEQAQAVNDDSFAANEEDPLLHRASQSEHPGCRHRLPSFRIRHQAARARLTATAVRAGSRARASPR